MRVLYILCVSVHVLCCRLCYSVCSLLCVFVRMYEYLLSVCYSNYNSVTIEIDSIKSIINVYSYIVLIDYKDTKIMCHVHTEMRKGIG